MFNKISVLIPTRGRVNRLETLLNSYERTTRGVTGFSELVFRADDDDQSTHEFMRGRMRPPGTRLAFGERRYGYASLPHFFNELVGVATGDVLMCGNDDMVFKTEYWAPTLLAVANRYQDGLFVLGVHTHNETHYPFATVSRMVTDRLGFLFDPRIFWGDIFLRDVMTALGRNVMVDHVQIDHDWAGHQPDATFLEGEDARRANWMQYHGQAVAEAVEKLRALVAA